MNSLQGFLQAIEVGKAQVLIRVVPLAISIVAVAFFFDFGPIQTPVGAFGGVFRGLSDAQSMDNAQLARQIVRHQGFTTEFLRPQAVAQMRDYATKRGLESGSHSLFPPDRFPPGVPRVIPDTYNAPGYPCLLAGWFFFTHPEFDQVASSISAGKVYSADRWIPLLNQAFLMLTAILVFALGRRLFDERVAWLSLLAFLSTDLIWRLSVTALSTTFVMFLVTGALLCLLEIFYVAESCFDNEDRSFGPAWLWGMLAAFLLGVACLTRLDLLALLVPFFVFLLLMPRGSVLLFVAIAVIVIAMVTPWFAHELAVCGNPFGSNFGLMLYGQGEYTGNQIYCMSSIPTYEHLFGYVIHKETLGIRWSLDHAWTLLGSNPLIFLFGASILHQFKRRRTRLFHWLLFFCALTLVVSTSLASPQPEAIGPWNTLIILFPCMIVFGGAFFFILLDRLNVQMHLLNSVILTSTVVIVSLPMFQTLANPPTTLYAFPPYIPPLIKQFGQYSQPDEWVTSDMPWATAWYADRPSLWLPDSYNDFQNLYDNVCPTGVIVLSQVTWSAPVKTFTTGEYKDWYAFTAGLQANVPLPQNFPLSAHTVTPPGWGDFALWSDRPRWDQQK